MRKGWSCKFLKITKADSFSESVNILDTPFLHKFSMKFYMRKCKKEYYMCCHSRIDSVHRLRFAHELSSCFSLVIAHRVSSHTFLYQYSTSGGECHLSVTTSFAIASPVTPPVGVAQPFPPEAPRPVLLK